MSLLIQWLTSALIFFLLITSAECYNSLSHKQNGFSKLPNGHTTSNPRQFDVDITSIGQRPNFDEFPRHFRVLSRCNFDGRNIHVVFTYFSWRNFAGRKIRVISTYFIWCNFDGRKIHVVSTYSFRCNFNARKIHVVSKYFYRCNLLVEKSTLFPRTFFDVISMVEICTLFLLTFFDVILMGKNSTSFLVSCKLIRGGVCNFKQLTFARLFSLNFSSKSPWCSSVPFKFEPYNLHHCRKYCCRVFLIFTEQLLYQIVFG